MNESKQSKLPKRLQASITNQAFKLFFSCGLAFGLGLIQPTKDLCKYELIQVKMTETDVRARLGSGLERKRVGNRKEIIFCSGEVIVTFEYNQVVEMERSSAK